jgi:TM2 domain-containing membrane protein YozV
MVVKSLHDQVYGSVRYSQEGMVTAQNKDAAAKQDARQGFVYLPLIAGWLVPGAGHFLLRKWGRGALLAASILSMFVLGIAMQGKLYGGAHDILDLLGLAGDLGNGLPYFLSRAAGLGADQVMVTTADYGTKFIVVAGLLNVIAAVDAHNLRTGRKS